MNVARKPEFSQVAVWRGTVVGQENVASFEKFFEEAMNVRVQYLEEVNTLPDQDKYGRVVNGTGGRTDVLFGVHKEDLGKFAIARFGLDGGCSWIEDAIDNAPEIYPARVTEYKTW